ncbi:hypothetical protein DKL61_05155 [Gammaproteobacteria bacterium ESL0073]|nr:hypothetical protein DKL61_05155 [Gammaproteobacteria bacterium ESL0073]
MNYEKNNTLTFPTGFAGEISKHIYHSSIRPVKEVAIVATLGLLAGICGKAWQINNTGLNIYCVLVARSAVGKEALHEGVSNLMAHAITNTYDLNRASNFYDFADFASGQALQKTIAKNGSFVNITGELGLRIKQFSNGLNKPDSPLQNLCRIITQLYSKSGINSITGGIRYSDQTKNIDSLSQVAYSLIGESTPATFYDSLTEDFMENGFLSRFTIIEYLGERPPENKKAIENKKPNDALLEQLRKLLRHALYLLDSKQSINIEICPEAILLLGEFNLACDSEINQATDNEALRQIWNRAHLKALKIAALLAVVDHMDFTTSPIVTTEQVLWAIELIKSSIKVFINRLSSGDIGNADSVREHKLLAIIKEYLFCSQLPKSALRYKELQKKCIIPRQYLQHRTQKVACFAKHNLGSTKALDLTIESLIKSGTLHEPQRKLVSEQFNFSGKCYLLVDDGQSVINQKDGAFWWP